jgi:hypothetical protein
MKLPFSAGSIPLIVLILAMIPATVRPMPPGDTSGEYWVDGPIEIQPGSDRLFPDVAVTPAGDAIFVWSAFIPGGSLRNDIYMRRIDYARNPLGDPIKINTLDEDDQIHARIAVSGDGSFLVIWQSDEFDPDFGETGAVRRWVRSQAFDENANPVGTEQLITMVSTRDVVDVHADVAALTGGGYVVVWKHEGPLGSDTNRNIQARLIGTNGVPSGAQFVANSSIGVSETYPAVTELADGGFLIIWTTQEVMGRRFSADGTPVGNDFQINTDLQGAENDPDAARGADGRILVVWEDAEGAGDDFEIRARMLSSSLSFLGDDFRVNTLIPDVQRPVRVGSYGAAGFLVAWESAGSVGEDADARSIQGRSVTGNNQFDSDQFQLNVYTVGSQSTPAVGGWGDRVAVAWRSPSHFDTEDDGIIGQTWSLCGIFCDSFE